MSYTSRVYDESDEQLEQLEVKQQGFAAKLETLLQQRTQSKDEQRLKQIEQAQATNERGRRFAAGRTPKPRWNIRFPRKPMPVCLPRALRCRCAAPALALEAALAARTRVLEVHEASRARVRARGTKVRGIISRRCR